MVLTQKDRNIDTNVDQSQVFKIKTTAQAFKILSSSLYSNKIRAIVREISCNAIDAHKLAKNPNPFVVHIPNDFEPYFSVKDFGTGLSEKDVFELYTSYFETTKSCSNDFIGALGLGSKSPFSYVDSFTIESIYEGEKKDYSAYISSAGVPTISLLNKTACDEHNGLEIKIPVEEKDYSKFLHEAQLVFYAFEQTPIIKGTSNFRDLKEQDDKFIQKTGAGWKLFSNMPGSLVNTSYARQGSILYPLNDEIIENNASPDRISKIKFMNNNYFIIDFPIGSLDIAASREEISYDEATIKNIIQRLVEIYDEIFGDIQASIGSMTLFDATAYLRSNVFYRLHGGNHLTFTHPSGTVITSETHFDIKNVSYYFAQLGSSSPSGIKLSYHTLVGKQQHFIHASNNSIVFIIVDAEIKEYKCRELMRHYITSNNMTLDAYIILVKPDNTTVLAECGDPKTILLSSIKLPDMPKTRAPARPRTIEKNYSKLFDRVTYVSYYDIKSDEPKYFLTISKSEIPWEHKSWKSVKDQKISYSSAHDLIRYFYTLGIFDVVKDEIYLIQSKETTYKRFKDDTTLKPFQPYLIQRTVKYIMKHKKEVLEYFAECKAFEDLDSLSVGHQLNDDLTKKFFWDRIPDDIDLKKAYLSLKDGISPKARALKEIMSDSYTPEVIREKLKELYASATCQTKFVNKYSLLNWVDVSGYREDPKKPRLIKMAEYVVLKNASKEEIDGSVCSD